MINIYRETEVSLQNFQEILDAREPRPVDPVPSELAPFAFDKVSFSHHRCRRRATA